jgi:hypothetical protein
MNYEGKWWSINLFWFLSAAVSSIGTMAVFCPEGRRCFRLYYDASLSLYNKQVPCSPLTMNVIYIMGQLRYYSYFVKRHY